MTEEKMDLYAVFAEAMGYDQPMIQINLPFGRLMDDIVVPYEADRPFFIDGAPLQRKDVRRLKIVRQSDFLGGTISDLHWHMREGNLPTRKLYTEQYYVRLEALLRESGQDVTSQVIQAFDCTIRPSLKDYLPKREELISAAAKVFLESIRVLGGGSG
jgi:hypothetical protein